MGGFVRHIGIVVALTVSACAQSEAMSSDDETVPLVQGSTLADVYSCDLGADSLSGLDAMSAVEEMDETDATVFCEWMRASLKEEAGFVTCEDGRAIHINVPDRCEALMSSFSECSASVCLVENCNLMAMLDPCNPEPEECLALGQCR